MGSIDNQIAIVTGGGGGIGGAIAQRFAREGAKLAIVDIDTETAESRATQLAADGVDTIALVADVTNKQSVTDMVQATLDRWKRIDILVNVAGGADRKPVIDMTAADWDHIVDMNLKSVFLCSQAALRQDRQHFVDLRFHRKCHPLQLRRGKSWGRGFYQVPGAGTCARRPEYQCDRPRPDRNTAGAQTLQR